MKLTLKQIVDGRQALLWLGSRSLYPSLALQVQRNIRLLNPEYEAYFERAKALGEDYGTLRKDGSQYDIAEENLEVFEEQLKALQAIEIDIALQVIKFTEFNDEPNFTIQPLYVLDLEWMFYFSEPEVEKEPRKRHPAKAK